MIVGVAGLGAMGRPIATRLGHAGFDVLGLDPHAAAIPGVHLVSSLAEADFVFVIVPTDEDVAEVVDGLLTTPHPGQIIAISASVRPETCRALAEKAATHGVDVLDVALTGGIRGAESGTLNLLIGGNPAVVERSTPVLAAISTGRHVLGPVGAGQVGKAASNLIHWAEIVAIDEAMRLAAAYGVAPAVLRAALQEGGTDSRTLRELELMKFTWWAKDIAIAEQMAAAVNRELPVAGQSRRLMPTITVESIRELLSPEPSPAP
ncbi:NAD(P)-dependent oxidoreductase [Actinoplanes sp. NPDC051513]|uniref:NAD(P)-dependent oxidoreductase n=1 Tax=Actinoplanes sp. NPDC051513 TaxID=3363908 RepID=UPI00379CE2A1